MSKMKNSVRKPIVAILFAVIMMASVFAVVPTTASVSSSRTYTLDADFDEGTLVGVEHETVHDQLQLSEEAVTLPFIWVPNSNEGTVSKVNTSNGRELGRYWTGPASAGNGNPSRTTVDLQGNCWVGNRNTGTVVKIGLYEAGQCNDTNGNGTIETSNDTNGDGNVTGSEILPWGEDECVLFEVFTGGGPRGLAIDANNDLWAGTYTLASGNNFSHIGGDNGTIFDTIGISPDRSYGALIDGNGNIWSSSLGSYVLKIDPTTKSITKVGLSHTSYGLGIDNNNHVFVAGWGTDIISKINATTNTVVETEPQGDTRCRGVAVTGDGDIWVINSKDGNVTRLDNNLNWKATIDIGAGNFVVMPTGAAVDAAGKVWACNYYDGYLHRIDPTNNLIDLSKLILGHTGSGVGMHYSYSDMTGIIARTVTTKTGTWTVDYDSGVADTPWGTVSWNNEPQGCEPSGTKITVKVSSSNDGTTWSTPLETAANGVPLSSTPDGRYLRIKTTLQIISGDVSPVLSDLTVQRAVIPVDVDIKPGSCPNPLNLRNKGLLPVAVLGTAEFDVTTIDPGTILLIREGCEGVAAIHWSYEDVATPFTGELCDCHDLNGDGYIDLTLKFDIQELVSNLKLDEVTTGEMIPLALTGNLKAENGGTPIEGKDCIWVLEPR